MLLPCAVVIVAVLVSGLWRCTGRGVPALLHVGNDRRITVTGCDGRSQTRDDPRRFLCRRLAHDDRLAARWRIRGGARAPAIVVLPDMLPADDFRRLRVVLRYGRPVARDATSEVDAG